MKPKKFSHGFLLAVVLQFGLLAGSAQTNIYLYSGSETNITLNPGTYIITAWGAVGGNGYFSPGNGQGGLGAEMSAEFNFSTPTNLTLLVGSGGDYDVSGSFGNGGGGSFVVEGNTPLVIAGGGGGAALASNGGNGNVSTVGSGGGSGGSHVGSSGGSDGDGGGGGEIGYNLNGTYTGGGGGGGGFLGNGNGGYDGEFMVTNGGISFENGGYGADASTRFGFGGGGGRGYDQYGGGGGGGGYSGGGGGGGGGFLFGPSGPGSFIGPGGGGGGGSIIDSSAITILAEVSGIYSQDDPTNGEIIITAVSAPIIITTGATFGFTNGVFGFNLIGPVGSNMVIQASADLQNWIPLETNLLGNEPLYFSDPQSPANTQRFYRVVSPYPAAFTVGGTLTGLPAGDTVTLQDNGSDNLTLSTNGPFTFPTALPNGQAYSVTVSGTSGGPTIQTAIYPPVTANGSGTISGANVTNVAVQCTSVYTGNLDLDMYNAAVEDGTANGGVPAVMETENGGPFRVTARGFYSDNMVGIYAPACVFTHVVGTTSCSSTTLPTGPYVIQFGTVLECGFGPHGY